MPSDLVLKAQVDRVETSTHDLDIGLLIAAASFRILGAFLDSELDQEMEIVNLNCRTLVVMSLQFGRLITFGTQMMRISLSC